MSNNGPRLVKYFNVVGVIDEDMLNRFLEFYESCINERVENAVLMISTPGGYVTILNSMLSIIEASNMTWWGVNTGTAYSCGLLLLAGCDYRYGTPRASYLWHDVKSGCYGTPEEMEEDIKQTKILKNDVVKRFV